MTLIGKKKKKGITIRINVPWTKVEISVLAYFKKKNNHPATYLQIARAYTRGNSTTYQKACQSLLKRKYLEKLKNGSFKVHKRSLNLLKRWTESMETSLPYFNEFLKKVK